MTMVNDRVAHHRLLICTKTLHTAVFQDDLIGRIRVEHDKAFVLCPYRTFIRPPARASRRGARNSCGLSDGRRPLSSASSFRPRTTVAKRRRQSHNATHGHSQALLALRHGHGRTKTSDECFQVPLCRMRMQATTCYTRLRQLPGGPNRLPRDVDPRRHPTAPCAFSYTELPPSHTHRATRRRP